MSRLRSSDPTNKRSVRGARRNTKTTAQNTIHSDKDEAGPEKRALFHRTQKALRDNLNQAMFFTGKVSDDGRPRRMSQELFCSETEWSRSTLTKILAGDQTNLRMNHICRLAELFSSPPYLWCLGPYDWSLIATGIGAVVQWDSSASDNRRKLLNELAATIKEGVQVAQLIVYRKKNKIPTPPKAVLENEARVTAAFVEAAGKAAQALGRPISNPGDKSRLLAILSMLPANLDEGPSGKNNSHERFIWLMNFAIYTVTVPLNLLAQPSEL
jgi:transcriptional regulator with XRE-family HTH domain